MTISKLTLRGSTRLKESDKRKIVDESSRKRRHRKVMEILECDNYHDDPHADLVMSKKAPKFDENLENRTRSKKKERSAEYYQLKYRKTFQQLVEDDRFEADETGRISYVDLGIEDSSEPARHFCAVCGFEGIYVCVPCGVRQCSIKCMDTHYDTRCLRWSV